MLIWLIKWISGGLSIHINSKTLPNHNRTHTLQDWIWNLSNSLKIIKILQEHSKTKVYQTSSILHQFVKFLLLWSCSITLSICFAFSTTKAMPFSTVQRRFFHGEFELQAWGVELMEPEHGIRFIEDCFAPVWRKNTRRTPIAALPLPVCRKFESPVLFDW